MSTDAADTLARADVLTAKTRQSTRWYGRYLLAYAAGAFAMSLAFGVLPGIVAVVAVTPVWMMFICAITLYAQRHRTTMRGLGTIHAWVIGSWTVLWGLTIGLGVMRFADWLPWWILGGVALALPGLIGAMVVFRRLRA